MAATPICRVRKNEPGYDYFCASTFEQGAHFVAIRPVYIPGLDGSSLVIPVQIEFQWFSGFSITQKQKAIQSLHAAASKRGINRILEISSKSPNDLGVKLSAFNLHYELGDGKCYSLENVFQSSKVFEYGGPYLDLLQVSAKEAKTDPRLRASGKLIKFTLENTDWPLFPVTAFYDWLYLNALKTSADMSSQLHQFDGFSDIEFNPGRSLNCQAASAALFVSLIKRKEFESAISNTQSFLARMNTNHRSSLPGYKNEMPIYSACKVEENQCC